MDNERNHRARTDSNLLGDWRAPQQCGINPENQRPKPSTKTKINPAQSARDICNHPKINVRRVTRARLRRKGMFARSSFLLHASIHRHRREPEGARKKQLQKFRADWLAEGRTTNGPKGVGLNPVQNWTGVWREIRQKRVEAGVRARRKRGAASSCHRRAATVTLTTHCLNVTVARAVLMHRLPHTTSMR